MEVSFRSPSVSEEDVQEIFDSHNIPNLIGDSPLAAAECVVEATTFDDTKFQKDDVRPGTLPLVLCCVYDAVPCAGLHHQRARGGGALPPLQGELRHGQQGQ